MRLPLLFLLAGLALPSLARAQSAVEQAKLVTAGAALGDRFGASVALSADWALVGQPLADINGMDSGGASFFRRVGTAWTEEPVVTGFDTASNDEFGSAVAMVQDVAFIGASEENDRGAVYVFELMNGVWSGGQKLTAADGQAGDGFGSSLDFDGETLVVGAPFEDNGNGTDAGAAYVFTFVGGSWQQQQKLTATGGGPSEFFSETAVAVDGDVLVVGSFRHDDNGSPTGAAFAFRRQMNSTWAQEARILPSDGADDDGFGLSVSLDGDRVLIGAPFVDDNGLESGAVYVVRNVGSSWTEEQKITPNGSAIAALFGTSVDLDGTVAAIGAPNQGGSGRGHLARRSGTSWSLVDLTAGSGTLAADAFGTALALDGGALVVSAPFSDEAGALTGSAYAFEVQGAFDVFCNGDGGDQMGCSTCPCSNDAPEGTIGGCLHGLGRAARLFGTGNPSLANDTLRFEVQDARPFTFAILSSGSARAPANAANPCFGTGSGISGTTFDGLRCVVQSIQRHGTRPSNANGDIGVTTNGWGTPSGPAMGLAAMGGFNSGQTRHFQAIYRTTPTELCGRQQNTTNGVTVVFGP